MGLTANGLKVEANTPHFSAEAKEALISHAADSVGNYVLEKMIAGFKNGPTQYIRYVEDASASDMTFNISKIQINRGWFTLDFTHPGPLYRIEVTVDVLVKGQKRSSIRAKALKNMSKVHDRSKPFVWLDDEQKADSDLHIATANTALRDAMGKLVAELFDIQTYQY